MNTHSQGGLAVVTDAGSGIGKAIVLGPATPVLFRLAHHRAGHQRQRRSDHGRLVAG
jgi:hypothetical protein